MSASKQEVHIESINYTSFETIQPTFRFRNLCLFETTPEFREAMLPEPIKNNIGSIAVEEFQKMPFFYIISNATTNEDLRIHHMVFSKEAEQITNFLWFAKDNSSGMNSICSFWTTGDAIISANAAHANSNCLGNFEKTTFSRSDLGLSVEIYNKLQGTQAKRKFLPDILPVATETIVHHTNYQMGDQSLTNRIERAINFLILARGQSYLPVKISFYISLLECIFTTDNSEVTHKVAERSSHYIGNGKDEKIDIYKKIKDAYGIRSKFFHGQRLTKGKIDELRKVSKDADDLVRRILKNVILKDSVTYLEPKNEILEAYFTDLIFS